MKKIISILFVLLLFFYVTKPPTALAACTFITEPGQVTTAEKNINMIISDPNFADSEQYFVTVNGNKISAGENFDLDIKFSPVNKTIRVLNLDPTGSLVISGSETFRTGEYRVEVLKSSGSSFGCKVNFFVTESVQGGACQIQLKSTFKSGAEVRLLASGQVVDTARYAIRVKEGSVNGNVIPGKEWSLRPKTQVPFEGGNSCPSGSVFRADPNNSNKKGFSLGTFSANSTDAGINATYYVEIMNDCGFAADRKCYATFSVPGGQQASGGGKNPTTTPICSQSGTNFLCNTGLGRISTGPTQIARSLFIVFLGLSGGIAVLLIMISGFEMISSRGNPDKIQGARDRLIAAIVGLLFIIFSFVILQVIGFDILRIPGFG